MTAPDAPAPAAAELDELRLRLRTLLPEEYRETYERIEPTPMRSAPLTYAADGTVAWDKMWGSFCDLAMAGGPPHKGALLDAGEPADIATRRVRYDEVADEICRGIVLATDLHAAPSPVPGWVRVTCYSETMAGWLLRAITMENVAVRAGGLALDLPAAPGFRLEKEIKNVITVVAKTSHYWLGHMSSRQKQSVAALFAVMAVDTPLVEPARERLEEPADGAPRIDPISNAIARETGLAPAPSSHRGWLGVVGPSVHAAVWMMRAAVASNVLARREGTTLFVPANAPADPSGATVVRTLARVHRLARASGVL